MATIPAVILCVDDNDANRYSVARSLRSGGYDVVEATNGADALRLSAAMPDLITLDVRLPDIDGFEVCRRIKANPETAHIPVLHISATDVDTEHRVRGLRGGADAYLAQPVEGEELLATVDALLRLKRAEREARVRADEAESAKREATRLNEQLQDTIERLRIAQQAAHSGTWEWTFDPNKVIWSLEQEAVYGLPPGTFSGEIEQWRQMVNSEDLVDVQAALQVAIDRRTEFHVQFRITRADGALRWIESFARVFYDQDGRARRIIGVNADITERKSIEEALHRSEFRFRRLVDSNIIPIICANMQGITEANDAFLKMIGCTRDDLVSGAIDWIQITPVEHLAKDMAAVEQLRTVGYCAPYEKEYVLKDGSRIQFLIGATVLSSSPLEWLCFLIDLRDLKKAEAEIRKAHDELEQKVKERTEQLATSISRLQSEMNVRRTTEQQLRELSARLLRLQDEERRRLARDLHDSTGQTLTALKLTLASLEYLITEPNASKLFHDLNALADQALQEIRTMSHLLHPPLLDEVGFSSAASWYIDGFAKRSGIRAKLEVSAVPKFSTEAELVFFRVLQESLTNVLRHSGSGTVDIYFGSDNDNGVLRITDYGKGMPQEKLKTFRETGAGVGVGLGGMKQRVRELGGHLTVDSDASGTCVTATLPLSSNRATGYESTLDSPNTGHAA